MNKKVLGILLICGSLLSQAQELMSVSEPQMADRLREDGKIYVVISVIGIIFLSLLGFLIYIERKVKRIEEKMK
jgi:heme/copper-type cytochrome/quinol oxidase subunit 2